MPTLPVLTDEEFREAVKTSGETLVEAQTRKGFITEIKVAQDAERTLDFTISTATVDRYGDTIAVDGWKLANFRRNPVVLWGHDTSIMPVGKASNVRVEDGKLLARAEFMPRDMSGFADAVFRAILAGYINATSVGFQPLKYSFSDAPDRKYGIDFLEQELLEFSIVTVPANPDCLGERSAGLALSKGSPLRSWLDDTAKQAGYSMIPTKQYESMMGMPDHFRALAERIPSKAKGTRGQLLRCANIAERRIMAEAEMAAAAEEEVAAILEGDAEQQPLEVPVETGMDADAAKAALALQRLEMARLKMSLIRQKLA